MGTASEGSAPGGVEIRPIEESDREWLRPFMAEHWGAEAMASRGKLMRPAEFPGFVAERDGKVVGVMTYRDEGEDFEVASLNSLEDGRGIGKAMLAAVLEVARAKGLSRAWLITTNDNIGALRFYQRLGWELVAVHRGAVDRARETLKPEIPRVGNDGIPIRDEIELEYRL